MAPSGQERVAWITGGGSGIGRALALALAHQGWQVWISGRRREPLQAVAAGAPAGRIRPLPADVTRPDQLQAAVAEIEAGAGRLDLAFLNAGDYRPMSLAEFDPQLFHHLNQVNYLGVVNCLAAVLPLLQRQRAGQLLLNASLAGYRGLPLAAPYGATKAALINLAEALRNELRDQGIRLRVVNPGFVRSPLTDLNDFRMPYLQEPEQAAAAILRRLDDDGFEIAFPRPFVWQMKLLRLLPYRWYFAVLRRLQR
jgi:NAD(P)-dependent dehydrogenase (short-subunit alcohol dehydrogenase family)